MATMYGGMEDQKNEYMKVCQVKGKYQRDNCKKSQEGNYGSCQKEIEQNEGLIKGNAPSSRCKCLQFDLKLQTISETKEEHLSENQQEALEDKNHQTPNTLHQKNLKFKRDWNVLTQKEIKIFQKRSLYDYYQEKYEVKYK